MQIGEAIRNERIRRHMTQKDLAAAVGVSDITIGRIEKGRQGVTLERLGEIARALSVSVDQLVRLGQDHNAASIL